MKRLPLTVEPSPNGKPMVDYESHLIAKWISPGGWSATLPLPDYGRVARNTGTGTIARCVAKRVWRSHFDAIRPTVATRRARVPIICRAIHNGDRLVLGPNRVATEPTRWRHSGCIQVTVQYGPKRLSGFPELDLLATGQEFRS
jgi:hypothetical protein